MVRRIVDLSIPLENDIPADPAGYELSIDYVSHQDTLDMWLSRYPGLDPSRLPNSEAFALERVQLSTHNGTHVDAPWHYASTMTNGDQPAKIDELPLEWFFGDAVKLDFRHFEDGYVVSGADVEAEFARIGHELKPLDIVLVNTSAGVRFGHKDYVTKGCGMGREATLYLTERGVRVAGTDAWSWDAPFKYMVERYKATNEVSHIWEGHRAGREIAYCHVEKLHNLEGLPANGFKVACFPVKIAAGSAGWTRAVAIFDE
jgi:kynurenine formamidase